MVIGPDRRFRLEIVGISAPGTGVVAAGITGSSSPRSGISASAVSCWIDRPKIRNFGLQAFRMITAPFTEPESSIGGAAISTCAPSTIHAFWSAPAPPSLQQKGQPSQRKYAHSEAKIAVNTVNPLFTLAPANPIAPDPRFDLFVRMFLCTCRSMSIQNTKKLYAKSCEKEIQIAAYCRKTVAYQERFQK